MSTQNPNESPRTESLPFTPLNPSTADLERRVIELERRVGVSWFLSNYFLTRVFVVWAYFLMGYAMIFAVVAPVMYLIAWLLPRF